MTKGNGGPAFPTEECNIGKEIAHGQCCCICRHHLKTFSHPSIDGKPISNQTGWACVPPEFGEKVFPGWWEHSIGCEMFTQVADAMLKARGE